LAEYDTADTDNGRDCSVGIATGRSEERIPEEAEVSRTHPDRPWGSPSILYNLNRVYFLGGKRPGIGFDYPPHLASRLKKECSYASTPSLDLHGVF